MTRRPKNILVYFFSKSNCRRYLLLIKNVPFSEQYTGWRFRTYHEFILQSRLPNKKSFYNNPKFRNNQQLKSKHMLLSNIMILCEGSKWFFGMFFIVCVWHTKKWIWKYFYLLEFLEISSKFTKNGWKFAKLINYICTNFTI